MIKQKNYPFKTQLQLSFLFISVLTIAGCSCVQQDLPESVVLVRSSIITDSSEEGNLKSKILKQYDEWRSTPYKMGGLSKRGIDCSGFTYVTFRSKLGCNLPRTVKSQVKAGHKVTQDSLLAGDLVFFKTTLFYRHVGIYLSNSEFLHASTSSGVMISSLNDAYWKKRYWTARRICK